MYPGYQSMGFAIASAFEIANRQAAEPIYDIRMLSKHGGLVRTSLGVHVLTEAFSEEPYDLMIVGASWEDASPETIEFIRHAHGAHADEEGKAATNEREDSRAKKRVDS
jgi:transcriptional regulator GlxA family with amidase domain